ncbi:AAA family ATPase [Chondromyces crocatus]|uniref:AAA family ATPase n=1 Tax=Chondromyces crocatus TaxID=52 RepID=UPI0014702991|nr:AAA family ATPase [Chondromyces crocatus]
MSPDPSGASDHPQEHEGRVARVHVLSQERFDGAWLMAPAAAANFMSIGAEEEVRMDQELFLRAYLHRARPELLSRLSLPEATRLVSVEVSLPIEALSRRAKRDPLVAFVCVVIPAKDGDAWVMVPAVGHTFYVQRGEEFEEVVRHEVRRLLASQELSAWVLRGLLPTSDAALDVIQVPLEHKAQTGRGASRMEAIAREARRRKAIEVLEGASTRFQVEGRFGPPPLVGRDAEQSRLTALLSGKERLGVLLVGPEGSGKGALMRAYAHGSDRPVFATSGAQLVAGMSGFGEWQERVFAVMAAAQELDAVLYIDQLEDLLSAHDEEGAVDLGGALRPFVDGSKVRLVCEVREDRVDALESRHWAFFAALSRIPVPALSPALTREVLSRRVQHDTRAEPLRPHLATEAIPALVDLCERYLPYAAFPGKAVRLYEDMRALREKEQGHGGTAITLGKEQLYETFSMRTGVPEFLLREDLPLRVEELVSRLGRTVIGQEQAVRALAETIAVVKAGLQPAGKPLATFLFVGPTGVGKTELARALAELLFGSAERMARFDMSEFMTPDAADRLIRGTDRDAGLLTRRVREQPFCVILLDEIEKAHPAVFDLLLQVCGEGRLSDARGQTAYFHNAILIMTSNLGSAERRTRSGFLGGEASFGDHYTRAVEAAFRPEMVNRIDRIVAFRPLSQAEVVEVARVLIERIASRRGLVEAGVGLTLSARALRRLASDGFSETYGARALRRHLEEQLVAPVARVLSGLGAGARDLLVQVTEAGEEAESEGALQTEEVGVQHGSAGSDGETGHVVARAGAGGLLVVARKRSRVRRAQQAFGYDAVSQARREVEAWMELDPIVELKDQMDFLLTQLNTMGRDQERGRKRRSADQSKARARSRQEEVAELQAEHHRLQTLWEELTLRQEEVFRAEEAAMIALFEGTPLGPMVHTSREGQAAFRKVLPHALTALLPQRNAITLIVEELDPGMFGLWLDPLLRAMTARGWVAEIHLDGDKAGPRDGPWPEGRRWGPPRSIPDALRALEAPKRSFRNVLLRCRGAYVGAMLALEAGLHRIVLTGEAKDRGVVGDEEDRAHVYVHVVAFETAITEAQWSHPTLAPPPAGTASGRRKGGAVREHDHGTVALHIAGRRARIPVEPGLRWDQLEEVALEHLLLLEQPGSGLDRDDVYLLPELSEASDAAEDG